MADTNANVIYTNAVDLFDTRISRIEDVLLRQSSDCRTLLDRLQPETMQDTNIDDSDLLNGMAGVL